jgi:endoglucanase
MLISAAIGDRTRFALVWSWTKRNLARPDALLSWHWVNGSVVDPQSAGDADLNTAWALTVAAKRFGVRSYESDARAIVHGILAHETVSFGSDRLLVGGPWAQKQPAAVDPSYFSPPAFEALKDIDSRVASMRRGGARALSSLIGSSPHLPPDWAKQSGTSIHPVSAPGTGAPPQYGYDANRVPIWYGASCDAAERRLAADMWPFLRRALKGTLASVYSLSGRPIASTPSPESLVAAAGAARAAGQPDAVQTLLTRAQLMNAASPSYYGTALVALGRIVLTSDLLSACA